MKTDQVEYYLGKNLEHYYTSVLHDAPIVVWVAVIPLAPICFYYYRFKAEHFKHKNPELFV